MLSKVWSLSYLLFLYSQCPPLAKPFVKVGASAPVPYGVGATGHCQIIYSTVKFITILTLTYAISSVNITVNEEHRAIVLLGQRHNTVKLHTDVVIIT